MLLKCELSATACKELTGTSQLIDKENWVIDPIQLLRLDEAEAAITLLSFTGHPPIPATVLGLCEDSLQTLRRMRADCMQALALALLRETQLMQTVLKKEPNFLEILRNVMKRLDQMKVDNADELRVLNSYHRPLRWTASS